MRITYFLAALSLAVASAPAALACVAITGAPIRNSVMAFWASAPTPDQLKPGEIVLKVAFVRFANRQELEAAGELAGDGRCTDPSISIYSILEVQGDVDLAPQKQVAVRSDYALPMIGIPILVGRLVPLTTTSPPGSPPLNLPLYELVLRLPVGDEAAPIPEPQSDRVVLQFPIEEIRLSVGCVDAMACIDLLKPDKKFR